IVRRQVLQHACETRKHPPITSTPEHLPTVAFAPIEEAAIAVEQSLLLVVQVVRGLPPEPVHEIGITTVTRGVAAAPVGAVMVSRGQLQALARRKRAASL